MKILSTKFNTYLPIIYNWCRFFHIIFLIFYSFHFSLFTFPFFFYFLHSHFLWPKFILLYLIHNSLFSGKKECCSVMVSKSFKEHSISLCIQSIVATVYDVINGNYVINYALKEYIIFYKSFNILVSWLLGQFLSKCPIYLKFFRLLTT